MDSSMKRFWALLLAASMIFSIMSMTVSAAETNDSGLHLDEMYPETSAPLTPEPTVPPTTEPPATQPPATEPEETVPVTSVPEETESLEQKQIESIEVLPLTLYPQTSGEWLKYKDPTTGDMSYYYRYNWQYEAKLKFNFTDGTSVTIREFPASSFTSDGKDWTFEVSSDQNYKNQWHPGNTYTQSVTLQNKTDGKIYTATASITISETSPLVSLSVEPVSIYQGQYQQRNDKGTWVYDFSRLIRFRAEFEDGTVIQETDNSFWYDGQRYFFNILHDATSVNSWKPGEHSAEISVMGQTAKMDITILESPVSYIQVNPLYIIENQLGGITETPEDRYFSYDWKNNLSFTVTFKDGRVETYQQTNGFSYNDQWFDFYAADDQETNHWLSGNSYTQTIRVLNKTPKVQIYIVENPISHVDIQPITVYAGKDDFLEYDGIYGEDGSYTEVPYQRYYWDSKLACNVYFKDGNSILATNAGLRYCDINYSVYTEDDQSHTNPWRSGNTYYTTVNILGNSYTVPVTVEGSVVKEVTFQPITLLENAGGYQEIGYYQYYWWNNLQYRISLHNGQVITGSGSNFVYDDCWYGFNYTDPQNEMDAWTVGNTYYVEVSAFGVKGTVAITIAPSPLQSVSVQPITLIKNTSGDWEEHYNEATGEHEKFYRYYWWDHMNYTANFADVGAISNSGTGVYYNDQWYYFECPDDQYSRHWQVGETYYMQASLMGKTVTVPVTIEESPLKSITFTPATVLENRNGWDAGGYYHYDWSCNTTATLYFADQTIVVDNINSGFDYQGQHYWFSWNDGQNNENPWQVNNTYTATVEAMGCTGTVQISVIPFVVRSLSAEPITLRENQNGYWEGGSDEYGNWNNIFHYNWKDYLQFTVVMENGDVIQCGANGLNYMGAWFEIFCPDPQGPADAVWYGGNTYSVPARLEHSQGYCDTDILIEIVGTGNENGFEYMVQNGMAFITNSWVSQDTVHIPETLGGYPVKGIQSLGWETRECTRHLYIPNSVTMLGEGIFASGDSSWRNLQTVSFGNGISDLYMDMFSGCKALEAVDVAKDNAYYYSEDGVVYTKDMTAVVVFPLAKTGTYYLPDSVQNADVIFENLGEIQAVIEFEKVDGYVKENGVVYNEDKTVLIAVDSNLTGSYIMPDSVLEIKRFAFQNSNLSHVTVSKNVTDIVYYTFYNANVQSVSLPDSVTAIEIGAFEDTRYLTHINMPANLERLGNKAFANSGITSVTIPGSVRQIENKAFYDSDLEELVLCEGIESIYYLAFANTKIRNLVIPDSVTYMDDAFYGCHELRSLTVGDGINWIGGFQDCYQLTEVHLGDNVNHIQMHAFRGCPITELTLGDNVWHIFGFAFDGADLQTLELPDTVTYIAYRAFGGNSRVQSISLPENLTRLSYKAFEDTGWYNAQPAGHVYLDGFYYNYKGQLPENAVLYLDENTRGVADELQMDHDLSAVIFRGDAPEHLQLSNVTVVYPADNATWENVDYTDYGVNLTMLAAKATGQCGENAYWALDEEGCLHILGGGAMADYSYGTAPWHAYRNEIKEVKVADTITYVGSYSFVFLQDVRISFTADAPAFGDNCFAATTGTVDYPTGCEGWDRVIGSQYGGEISWDIMDDVYASDECGENMHWTLDVSGTLTISGTGYMWNGDWKQFDSMIKRIVIEEGVLDIAAGAFQHMTRVEKVIIADSVESISSMAFYGCTALKQVKLAQSSSLQTIGNDAFSWCTALEDIQLPLALQYICGGAFQGCSSLKELNLPISLRQIEWNAFSQCSALESIVLPDGLTLLGEEAFKDCVSLSYVQLPQSIHELAYGVFSNCISLKSIELPENVTALYGAFNRSSLENITVPASVQVVGGSTFRYCDNLQTVTFLGTKPEFSHDAFLDAYVTVYYPGDDLTWEGIESENYGGNPIWVPLYNYVDEGECGEGLTWHLKQDGTLVFEGFGVMDNFTRGNAPWSAYADQIIDVQLGDVNTIGDYAFYGCDQLLRVTSNWVSDIGKSAFEGCTGLMHYGIDGLQRMGDYAFAGCTGLTDFAFPEDMQTIGSHAFHGCTGLTQVTVSSNAQLGSYIFQNCTSLEVADLAYNTEVSEGMFSGCTNLHSVLMSRKMTSIGDEAFLNCEKLGSIYLDKNVTYIGDFAFFGCTGLEGLQIPENVTYVGSFAMHNCTNMSNVVFLGDAPQFGYQPLSQTNAQLTYFSNTNGWSEELIAALGGSITTENLEKTFISLFRNGSYMAAYKTMEAALEEYNAATDYLHVSYDQTVDITLTQDLCLDLKGNDVSGVIRTNGHKVILVDSATDYYYCDSMGYFSCTDENGAAVVPEKLVYMDEARYGAISRYMTIETELGWTAHRFYMGITHTSLKPASVGIGYKSVFHGDHMVISQLDSVGYMLQMEGGAKRTFTKQFADMYSGKEISLRINNWDIPNHGETNLYAQVCLQLRDGTVVESAIYSTTMRQAVENMNQAMAENPHAYSDEQVKAVKDMLSPYLDALKDWIVDTIRDRVTVVDPSQFNPNLDYVEYGTGFYDAPDGSGLMECLSRTVLNTNSVFDVLYTREPWGITQSIIHEGETWYEFAGAGDGVYCEITEHYVDFFLDTEDRDLIRCELLSDGTLRVVSAKYYFKPGTILIPEAKPVKLQLGSYQAPVIGTFGFDDYYYEESICIQSLSFYGSSQNGAGGVWLGDIYLPDKNWAEDPNDPAITEMIFNDRTWYKWYGGGMGDDTTYSVSGNTVTINICGNPEEQIICELLPDGNLKVLSAAFYLKAGTILYYEG